MTKLMLTISAAEWDGIQHRPHHFMRRSARTGWRVVYVEPPATLLAPLKNKEMLVRWKNWRKGLRKAEDGIYLLSPPPTLPFGNKYRWVNKVNQWLISRSVKKALNRIQQEHNQKENTMIVAQDKQGQQAQTDQLDLFTFLPNAIDLIPYFSWDQMIYDCVDDHAAFTGLIDAAVVHQMEKELMHKANVSFSTARQLMEDRQDWSHNFHLVPNGAEFEHFEKASTQGAFPTPVDLQSILELNKPIVGFYGGISNWIDIPLIAHAAKKLSEVSFILIGPVATSVDELKQLPNVYLLGSKPYQQLPSYLQHFDTCLVPFRINKLTESVNPVKLYEYLSAGKPIVSTPLPEVVAYQEVVEIGSNEDEFVSAIEKTLQPLEKEQERMKLRQEVGRENSWDARWNQAVSLIGPTTMDLPAEVTKEQTMYVTSE